MDGREFMRRLERRNQLSTERLLRKWERLAREWTETPEQRRQRVALEEEERMRKVLAEIGCTLEEFEERGQEFRRKFYGER